MELVNTLPRASKAKSNSRRGLVLLATTVILPLNSCIVIPDYTSHLMVCFSQRLIGCSHLYNEDLRLMVGLGSSLVTELIAGCASRHQTPGPWQRGKALHRPYLRKQGWNGQIPVRTLRGRTASLAPDHTVWVSSRTGAPISCLHSMITSADNY